MIKGTHILLVLCILFSVKFTFSQIDLSKMQGEYLIDAGMRMNEKDRFKKSVGTATFSEGFAKNQVKESFRLVMGNREFKGIAFINKSESHNRYELFQIDAGSNRRSTIFLLGIESEGKLKFSSKKDLNFSQWGKEKLKLKWEYTYNEDGSFKKEMLMPNEEGKYFVQSYYIYNKIN